jgi:hypothetical protein
MKLKKTLGLLAAVALALSMAGPALADTDTENVDYVITAGTQFSIEITDGPITGSNTSTAAFEQPFTIGDWPVCNWSCTASYTYEVTDLRGTALGWNVKASASAFTGTLGTVSGAELYTYGPPDPDTNFTAGPGSISSGVSINLAIPNIMTTPDLIIQAAPGVNSSVQPNGAGTFSDLEVLQVVFPTAIAVGTYTSVLTLTLASGAP